MVLHLFMQKLSLFLIAVARQEMPGRDSDPVPSNLATAHPCSILTTQHAQATTPKNFHQTYDIATPHPMPHPN